MLKILTVGDIVGESGLKMACEVVPNLKEKYNIDFVIMNGENAAGGMGITEPLFKKMISLGKADVITMGNHTWGKKDIFKFIDNEKLIRPANYPEGVVGKGFNIYKCNNKNIGVINLLGRTDMGVLAENPFIVANNIINKINSKCDIIVVDFHAEATAEKIAMGYFLDGKVQIIYGTHTHVQTADDVILPKGTAYITDIGMTGPKNSVIGMDIKASLKRFTTTLPEKYKLAEGECIFNACIFEINDENNQVMKITKIKQ